MSSTLSSRTVGAWPLKALEPRAGGQPPPCNVATVAMDARVNNIIAVTQPYMFEPSEPDTDSESDRVSFKFPYYLLIIIVLSGNEAKLCHDYVLNNMLI